MIRAFSRVLIIAGLVFLAGCASLPGGSPAAPLASATAPAAQPAEAASRTPTEVGATPTSVGAGSAAASDPSATPASATLAAAAPTAACGSPAVLTPAVTEGPYFKAGSPERSDLSAGDPSGTRLTISGQVLGADCRPVAHALLDFWQANAKGVYDNSGYTLRGHLYTGADGRYQLVTVVPGLYPGRTEHIHVKVQAPGGPLLTTQLFFPGVRGNDSDAIFDPRLVMSVQSGAKEWTAQFSFVVATK